MLEFGEQTLNAPAVLVGDAIIFALDLAVSARRNDDSSALCFYSLAQAVGVIGFIGKDLACLNRDVYLCRELSYPVFSRNALYQPAVILTYEDGFWRFSARSG